MGWTFNCVDYGKDAFIESLTSAKHFSEGFEPLTHRVVGNHVWQAVRTPAGRVMISLDLIAKERGGGWGYKGMTEDWGPCYYDCPIGLLDMCTDTDNQNALAWRAKVREWHARKKAVRAKRSSIKAGDVIKYGPHEYRLYGIHPFRKHSWHVTRVSDGAMFSMSNRQINQALEAA